MLIESRKREGLPHTPSGGVWAILEFVEMYDKMEQMTPPKIHVKAISDFGDDPVPPTSEPLDSGVSNAGCGDAVSTPTPGGALKQIDVDLVEEEKRLRRAEMKWARIKYEKMIAEHEAGGALSSHAAVGEAAFAPGATAAGAPAEPPTTSKPAAGTGGRVDIGAGGASGEPIAGGTAVREFISYGFKLGDISKQNNNSSVCHTELETT